MNRANAVAAAGVALVVATVAVAARVGTAAGIRIVGSVAATIAFVMLIEALRAHGADASGFEQALLPTPVVVTDRPQELERLERVIGFHSTELDLHVFVRPVLRDVAMARLWSTRGIDLDRDDAAACAELGDDLFELVRADRERPTDRSARSRATISDVSRYVARLEAL